MKFPQKSMISQLIPQERFVSTLNAASNLKKVFNDTVEAIRLLSTLNTETIFVHHGEYVKHIDIIEVTIRRQALNPQIIELIHREMAGYTIFIIHYEEWAQIWCSDFSEHGKYHQTSWQPYEAVDLELSGYDMDQVYLNCYRQITGDISKHFITESIINPIDRIASESFLSSINVEESESDKLEEVIKKLESQIVASRDFGQTVKLSMQVRLLEQKKEAAKKNSKSVKILDDESEAFKQDFEIAADAAEINMMQFNVYRRIDDRSS